MKRFTDGKRWPADWIGRHIAASGFVVVLAVSVAVGIFLGLLWGEGAATAGGVIVFGVSALIYSGIYMSSADRLAAERERALRFERAVSTASRALLKRDVVDPVGSALGEVIDVVDADTVFLETNSLGDFDENGNMATVRDVLYAGGPDGSPGRWELTGWKVGGKAQKELGSGRAFSTVIGELDPLTVAFYKASFIGSEVLLPITAEGRWVGSVGLTCRDRDRYWSAEERHLLRSVAEMIGAYWERRDAKSKLEELLAAKDEFIASVSHEVRTPLTAVLGFAHELDEQQGKFSPEEQADLIGLIAAQSREVANIVDDLLTAARAEAGTLVIAPESLSVRKLVGEVLSSHSGRVDFAMDEDLELWADSGRVRQILRNLLTNAERYGGSIVKIHVRRDGEFVRVEVRDNGDGIPVHLRDHVFEPYARAKNSATQPASVGLGLSVARQLAQLMNGDLELGDDEEWTVFALNLPVRAPNPERKTPAAAAS
jgi:signal transduction histidine kinase